MKVYKELYGADIDGNRGIMITEYEIEDSDFDTICDQILDKYPDGDVPDSMTIYLPCPYSDEEVGIEINPKDYL